jgi:lysophospholipase L1-like esterase
VEIAQELDAYNAAAAEVCARRGVAFVDITPISRTRGAEDAMLTEDGLHPSAAMYTEWTALALPAARGLLHRE